MIHNSCPFVSAVAVLNYDLSTLGFMENDSLRQLIKVILVGSNGHSLRMAPDMVFCVLLFLSSVIPVKVETNMSRPGWEEECSEPCSGEKCERLKSLLKEEVDRDLDPCEDFYQFACGTNTGRPKVEPMDSFLDLVRSPHEGYGFVRDFYRSCANIPTGITTEQSLSECIKDGQGDFFLLCGFLLK